MSKQCQHCKRVFLKDYRTSRRHFITLTKYCSLACKHATQGLKTAGSRSPGWKGRVNKICLTCHKEFQVHPYRSKIAKFCSQRCLGRSRGGAKSPQWKGGVTPFHRLLRASDAYKVWRTNVFARDNYTCQDCGQYAGRLEADHIKPFSRYPKLRFETSNGQTLCKSCHAVKTSADLKTHWVNQFSNSLAIN